MDRHEDDKDRVAAPEPYRRDVRVIRVVALLTIVVGAALWIWTVEGFRRIADTLTIGKTDTQVLDPTPGAFGSVVSHDGATDALGFDQSGGLRPRTGHNRDCVLEWIAAVERAVRRWL